MFELISWAMIVFLSPIKKQRIKNHCKKNKEIFYCDLNNQGDACFISKKYKIILRKNRRLHYFIKKVDGKKKTYIIDPDILLSCYLTKKREVLKAFQKKTATEIFLEELEKYLGIDFASLLMYIVAKKIGSVQLPKKI